MRIITLDIETQNFFQDTGSNEPASLDISVVCIHDSLTDSYKSFLESDMKGLWPILESADGIVTWNGDHFDIPLLNKYYPGDLTRIKSIDLMREVQTVLGRRLKLDSVAAATLGISKSGNGAEAVEWWRKGEVDKIIAYCTDDVRITKELFEYAMKNGHLKYRDAGNIRNIPLNTGPWQTPLGGSLTFTLPF
ncbi:MAG: ribonuclease H-like domain-containing protein [Candidatus Taylorbacteria bacterium]|nr:ribonuclease H-like domain-containing protein [Candidatus Taylorbacteria bacterium]